MAQVSKKNNTIAKNTLFLYLRMFFVLGVSLYTTRVVFNVLGVVDYGIYNVVSGFVLLFSFLNTSLANGVQRYYNYSIGRKGEYSVTDVYNMSLLIQLIFGVVLVLVIELGGLWYMDHYMTIPAERLVAAKWVFHTGVLSLFLVIMQIPYSAAVIAYEKMDYYAVVNIVDVVARLVAIIVLPCIDVDKLALYGCLLLMINVLDLAMYAGYCKLQFDGIVLALKFRSKLFRDMLVFSGWNIFGTFSFMLQSQGMNLLLNGWFGPVLNAARGVANMVQAAVQGFQGNIVLAFRPQIVQSYAEGDYERVREMFNWLSKISYVMLLVIITPLTLELHQVLEFWLGDKVPEETYIFTTLVLVNTLISSLNTPVTQVIHATGRMKLYQIAVGTIICMSLPVAWLFLKMGCEPYSVFVVCILFTLINQIVSIMVLRRYFAIDIRKYVSGIIIPLLVVTVLTPVAGWYLCQVMDETFLRLVIVGAVSVCMCLALSYYVLLNGAERRVIVSFIQNKIRKS